MMLFSSIDQFYVFKRMGEIYGGFLGSHFKGEDIFHCYGNSFGTRIKVIVITKNFKVSDKLSIKNLTTGVHKIYLESMLNPLTPIKSSSLGEDFHKNVNALLEPISCNHLNKLREEFEEAHDRVDSLPQSTPLEEADDLTEISEVEEGLEASVVNSKTGDMSMKGSMIDV